MPANLNQLNFPDWPELREGIKLCDQEFILKVQSDLKVLSENPELDSENWIAENICVLAKEHLTNRGYSEAIINSILT